MGFSGLKGDCLRSSEAMSPDSRKFPSVEATSDSFFFLHIIFENKNGTNGINVYVHECTLFL